MQAIKRHLRKVQWLYRLNAMFKCMQAKRSYRATIKYYAQANAATPRDLLQLASVEKRRVFFMGTDEQQDKSGFLQALEHVADVRCFTRNDGSWGQNDSAPYTLRRERNTKRLWSLFEQHAQESWIPDLLLMQTWGCLIEPSILSKVREKFGTIVCNISMDDRHQYWGRKVQGEWSGSYALIPHIDMALTAAPEAVEWYRKEGCAAYFFPEASDPNLFKPMPEEEKLWDVSFVGSRYGIRGQIVHVLRRAGIQVAAYGSGWENGRITTEDVPRLFAQSKIILGVSAIGHCQDFVGLKLRDFDAPMSGSCYVTQHNDDLHELYEVGREIVTYRDIDECVEKVRYLLGHESARETIAKAGRERALRDHTWDKRFATLIQHLGWNSNVRH